MNTGKIHVKWLRCLGVMGPYQTLSLYLAILSYGLSLTSNRQMAVLTAVI